MTEVKIDELGRSISVSLTLSEDRASRFMGAFVDVVQSSLSSGKEVSLDGLGTLAVGGKDGKPLPASYSANLIGEICGKLNENNDDNVRSMLGGLVGAMCKEILEGKKVILDDIGTFEVRHESPEIERQPKGHRLIKPAMTMFKFNTTKTYQTPVGEGALIFQASEDFRKKIDQFRESTIMLVAPDHDYFVKTLEYYFENAGWDIEVFTSIEEANKKIETGKAYLVVVDAGMPGYQEFISRLKMKKESSSVPLILMFPSQEKFDKLEDVTIIGDENLAQPFEFRKLLDSADSEILRAAEEQLIFEQQLSYQLPTDEKLIEKIIEDAHKLFETSGLNEEAQVAMAAAFREAVVNAAQHGNKYKKDKKIEVQYLLDREKVTIVVKDQGPGFQHELYVNSGAAGTAIAAARERHQQGRMGGLGILLMLRCCDRLEYNQNGNQITISKFLKPQN